MPDTMEPSDAVCKTHVFIEGVTSVTSQPSSSAVVGAMPVVAGSLVMLCIGVSWEDFYG